MHRRETGRDGLPFTKNKVFKRLRYRLSVPETAGADHKVN